jgi:murein DD-endopeptidase MepM/ murein hydrolase activator NlpD
MLLILKTTLVVLVLLVWAPAAYAWSWPVQGPVLQPFAYDESHPYASGQHRGIDIGADAAGEQVVAPAAGTVTFAGSVPTNGESLTIQTPDGYAVTLTHLGAILVAKGVVIDEGQAVATIGPSGTPELDRPYVHLGIRTASDPNGYLDPLGLLPPPAPQSTPAETTSPQTAPVQSTPAQSSPAAPQPSTSSAAASAPAQPAPAAAASTQPVATTRGSTVSPGQRGSSVHERTRAQRPRVEVRPQRPARPPASRHATAEDRARRPQYQARERASRAAEATAPSRPAGLDAGHEIHASAPVEQPAVRPRSGAAPLPLALNGAAALVALAAALAARRRRSPVARAEIVHLPRPGPLRRAA